MSALFTGVADTLAPVTVSTIPPLMGYARKSLVCLEDTPYYHVIARCVRRAWLWGFDAYAGRDYSHRKAWVLERLEFLSGVFGIDICAYAIMSNHYHLVLHVDRERIRVCSPEKVIERWSRLFRIPPIVNRWMEGIAGEAETEVALTMIEVWRRRLSDVSWFMRSLNEISRTKGQCRGSMHRSFLGGTLSVPGPAR